MNRIAIVGSRTFNDYELVRKSVLQRIDPSEMEAVIPGGARGADALAEQFASEFNIPMKIYFAVIPLTGNQLCSYG